MRTHLPFLDMTQVRGLAADLAVRLRYGEHRPHPAQMPPPCQLSWAGFNGALADAELRLDDAELSLSVFGGGPLGPSELGGRMGVLNEPAVVALDDGSTVRARFASVTRRGALVRSDGREQGGVQLDLDVWEWLPQTTEDCVLFAELGLVNPPGCNLILTRDGAWDARGFRCEGSLTWMVMKCEHGCVAVVEPRAEGLVAAISADLLALEFVSGCDIEVGPFWLINQRGAVVGGLGLGGPKAHSHRKRSPVPDRYTVDGCWAAWLFRMVAEHTASTTSPVSLAITGYLDAVRGHVHGQYLSAQVALEAFCRATRPDNHERAKGTNVLVRDSGEWQRWVDENTPTIRKMATDADSASILLNKLKHNVPQRPSGSLVVDAFTSWGLDLPQAARLELAGRNRSAHAFTMFDEESGDFQDAADRVDIVQTLLAAAVARHVGYEGPLVGWVRGDSGHLLVPDFWAWKDAPEAHERFVCAERSRT